MGYRLRKYSKRFSYCSKLFYTFNSSNISNWQPIHNSDTNWFIGAFDKNSTSMFDMGWGIYNMVTHFVTGDSLYAIKTVNGNWKKLEFKNMSFILKIR